MTKVSKWITNMLLLNFGGAATYILLYQYHITLREPFKGISWSDTVKVSDRRSAGYNHCKLFNIQILLHGLNTTLLLFISQSESGF